MNTDQIVAEARQKIGKFLVRYDIEWSKHYTSEINAINNNGQVVPVTPCP